MNRELMILVSVIGLALGLIVYAQSKTLTSLRSELNQAHLVNAANQATLENFQSFQNMTKDLLLSYQADRKVTESLRREVRNGIQKLLQSDEDFRAWSVGALPSDAIRMFNETAGRSVSTTRE